MNRLITSKFFYIAYVSIVGFFFHLTWEYIQCSSFFIHLDFPASTSSMIQATLGDLGIVWFAYFATAALKRSFYWPKTFSIKKWAFFIFVSILFAVTFEYFSVDYGRWSYTKLNPTIGKISAIPIFQMALLNPLIILVANKLLSLRKPKKQELINVRN